MGIIERRLRQKEEVRASILQAAWRVVEEEDWQSLSIRKIADAIEYSVPVIYAHFENKDAILLEFTRQGFDMLAGELLEARNAHKKPCRQLEAMAQAYWFFAFKHPKHYQIMFGLGIPACDRVSKVTEIRKMTAVMITVIQQAIAEGKHPDADYFLKFHTYWSILHGLVSIHMIGNEGMPEATKQMVLQDAIAGFIKALVD